MNYGVVVQSPDNEGAVLRMISRSACEVRPDALIGSFAYSTKKGVCLLTQALETVIPEWKHIRKEWVVSIDYGLTEPEAITALQELPNSEVRIPYATEVIRRHLRPQHTFHGKSLVFHEGDSLRCGKGGMVVASANMTVNGLCFGHEHASSYTWGRKSEVPSQTWAALEKAYSSMLGVFHNGTDPTPDLLCRYQARRPRRIQWHPEDERPEAKKITAPCSHLSLFENASLASASSLWIDIDYVVENLGDGRPGNQIDLQRGTRVFFGIPSIAVSRNTLLGEVKINYRGRISSCHLRYGNNQMDKLNLPVPGPGSTPPYQGKTLLLTRQDNSNYKLNVRSRSAAAAWKARSRNQHTLFRMRSGREYGVF